MFLDGEFIVYIVQQLHHMHRVAWCCQLHKPCNVRLNQVHVQHHCMHWMLAQSVQKKIHGIKMLALDSFADMHRTASVALHAMSLLFWQSMRRLHSKTNAPCISSVFVAYCYRQKSVLFMKNMCTSLPGELSMENIQPSISKQHVAFFRVHSRANNTHFSVCRIATVSCCPTLSFRSVCVWLGMCCCSRWVSGMKQSSKNMCCRGVMGILKKFCKTR